MHEAQCPARHTIFEPEIRILAMTLLFANLGLGYSESCELFPHLVYGTSH